MAEGNANTKYVATVVIPTLNPGADWHPLMDALAQQVCPHAFEILVIDSGSRPGQLRNIEEYEMRLIRITPEQFGHGKTRNLGVRHARGRYIAFLTQDAKPEPHWLAHLIDALEAHPQAAGAYSRQLPRPGADHSVAQRLHADFPPGDAILVKSCPPGAWESLRPDEKLALARYDHVAALARRSHLMQSPLADLPFAEDLEWSMAQLQAGASILYVPQSRVIHSHQRGFLPTYRRAKTAHRYLSQTLSYQSVTHRRDLWRAGGGLFLSFLKSHLPIQTSKRQAPGEWFRLMAELLGQYHGQKPDI